MSSGVRKGRKAMMVRAASSVHAADALETRPSDRPVLTSVIRQVRLLARVEEVERLVLALDVRPIVVVVALARVVAAGIRIRVVVAALALHLRGRALRPMGRDE
jgi:hypothetical protein